MAQGNLTYVQKFLKEFKEDRARLFPVVPSDKARGSGHKLENRRIPLNKQTLLLESDGVLRQIAQGHCGISSRGDIQKLSGHGHGQLAVDCPAGAGGWTR